MGKTAVHFGAGNIGRGFVACFLHESGYDVVFVDVMDSVINQLSETPSYKVIEVGVEGTAEKTITNYKAINSKYNEKDVVDTIASADVVTCSVGPNILKFIAPVIAKGLLARDASASPLAVIACENAIGATDNLAGFIRDPKNTPEADLAASDKKACYANSAIDRIVPAQEPGAGLDVKLEKFFEWVVDKTPFGGSPPSIDGIHWVDNLAPFIERKLFTVNTGHATAAYTGYNMKKKTVDEALSDATIMGIVEKALAETTDLIVTKHGIPLPDQQAYAKKIITRISNPHLADAVERVGRAPLRKLSRKERFIGPAFELAEMGKDCSALLTGAEMAFRFQNVEGDDESKELAAIMKEKPEDVVAKVCGVSSGDKIFPMLVEVVKKVQG